MNSSECEDDLIEKYHKVQKILRSKENNNADNKYDAWRQQMNIITRLFKQNDTLRNSLLENHCIEQQQELLGSSSNEFVNKRLERIESILNYKKDDGNGAFQQCPTHIAFPCISEIENFQNDEFERINLSEHVLPKSSASHISVCINEQPDQTSLQYTNESGNFKTAAQIFKKQKVIQNNSCSTSNQDKYSKNSMRPFFNYGLPKKCLNERNSGNANNIEAKPNPTKGDTDEIDSLMAHPTLKCFDVKLIELITNEIIQKFKPIEWHEIAGLDYAKSVIKEAVVYPLLRPDIFTGLRRPPRGILLFGPPGTGKTLIGKCIASQSKSTFFNISASSLTSKWVGESEKLVRALFAVAVARQPSIIFIDEVDSLLSQRSDNENECTRRLKTEFLVRLDGASTLDSERILIVGATNRPQELDEAVRRRFIKRLYIPLPEYNARLIILQNLLQLVNHNVNLREMEEISKLTEGYSGADMDSLCREASMEPLRTIPIENIETFHKDNLRPVNVLDFKNALIKVKPSNSQHDLQPYIDWNKTYGCNF